MRPIWRNSVLMLTRSYLAEVQASKSRRASVDSGAASAARSGRESTPASYMLQTAHNASSFRSYRMQESMSSYVIAWGTDPLDLSSPECRYWPKSWRDLE